MKGKQRRRLQHDGNFGKAGRAHEKGIQTGDDSVPRVEFRSSFATAFQDHELEFCQELFCDHASRAAAALQLYDRGCKVDKQDA